MSDGEVRMRAPKSVVGTLVALGALLIVIAAAVIGGEIGRAFLEVR